MALMIPRIGQSDGLQYFVNKAAPQDLVMRLFKNDITPAETDTAASYTEATFTGYAAITLTGASWGAPVQGTPSNISYAQQTFTSSATQASQSIYGYYYTRFTSGNLAGAERFSGAPFPIANNGDNIKITPQITATHT